MKDSASVGASIRGYIGWLKVASPNHEVKHIYDEMLLKYSKLESSLSIV